MIKIDNETVFDYCNGCSRQSEDIKRIRFSSDSYNSSMTVQLCAKCRENLVKLVNPLYCVNIDDTTFKALVKSSIGSILESSMNNGMAYWFSQQNIMNETKEVIKNMIGEDVVKEAARRFDVKECKEYLSKRLADCILNQMGYED